MMSFYGDEQFKQRVGELASGQNRPLNFIWDKVVSEGLKVVEKQLKKG